MVSGYAAQLSIQRAGMVAKHVAHERPSGSGPADGSCCDGSRGRPADGAERVVPGAIGFERIVFSRAHGVGGEALAASELRKSGLPANSASACLSIVLRPHLRMATAAV